MDLQLKNKVALVTGSTMGIGFASAHSLLKEGATVYVNGRTKERIDQAVKQLKNLIPNAQVKGIAADFSNVHEVDNLLKELPEVDILVNNVGIYGLAPFTEITDEEWIRYFEVNVLSGIRLSRHYLPLMLKKNWGRIIFISSESGVQIPKEMIHYGMTKTALLSISRGLAELTKGTAVTVNAILPGPTTSEGVDKLIETIAQAKQISVEQAKKAFVKEVRPTSLLERLATDEEVANLITYVASPLSSATNGAALRVDGGVVLSAF